MRTAGPAKPALLMHNSSFLIQNSSFLCDLDTQSLVYIFKKQELIVFTHTLMRIAVFFIILSSAAPINASASVGSPPL